MRRSRLAVLLGLLVVVASGDAAAQDSEEYPLEASLVDGPKEAVFKVSCAVGKLPDGTLLNVDLLVEHADSQRAVKAASFRVRVEGGTFAAEKSFPNQRWAPLVYRARVELQVGKQRKGVRDWFEREMGLGGAEQVVLTEAVVKQGSDEERAEFQRATLVDMRAQLLDLKKLLSQVSKAIAKPRDEQSDWQAKLKEVRAPLLEFDGRVRKYLADRVSWHEQRVIGALRGTTGYLFQVLTMHFEKNNVAQSKRMLKRAEHELKAGLQRVEGRLPKGAGGKK